MAAKVRLTQEEEILKILESEGFRELTAAELRKEPYKSLTVLPACFNVRPLRRKGKKRALTIGHVPLKA